jgi:hypothetical protein
MKIIVSAVSAALLFASCAPSTPQARIQKHPEKFEALGENDRALVEQGQLASGMSTDAVFLAWGAPAGVFQGSKAGKSTERWDYVGSRPVYTTNFHGGYGFGPYGRYGYSNLGYGFGPDVAYVPYRIASVWFVNSRVDSWERAR